MRGDEMEKERMNSREGSCSCSQFIKSILPLQKRSQVSVFVILGIIVLVVALFFVINGGFESVQPEVRPLHAYITSCLESVIEDALFMVGEGGGYVGYPEFNFEGIAYYLYEEKSYMPSLGVIEEELSLAVEFILPFCVDEFNEVNEAQGFNWESGEVRAKSKIRDDKVEFSVEYPWTFSKGNETYRFKYFEAESEVRLGIIHKAVSEYMEEQLEEPRYTCMSCLHEIGEKYEVEFYLQKINETNDLFVIVRDPKSDLQDGKYNFNFVNKMSESEVIEIGN